MAVDSPDLRPNNPKLGPAEIAQDIATNVEAAMKDPSNKLALEALHLDSQILDGKFSKGANGGMIDNNKPLQDAVQAELKKLGIPDIQIVESGQIDVTRKLTEISAVDAQGVPETPPTARQVLAGPHQDTQVGDLWLKP